MEVNHKMEIVFKKEETVDTLLDKISEYDIYRNYTGREVEFRKHILSPLRDDKHPSFSYTKGRKRILWKDWGTGEMGDCINLVMKLYDEDTAHAIKRIKEDMLVNAYSTTISMSVHSEERLTTKDYDITYQPFTAVDQAYWNKFNISLELLTRYNVRSVKYIYTKDKLNQFYTYNNPIYAYIWDDNNMKIYRPYAAKEYKWKIIGKGTIEGLDQLPNMDSLLIITKSLKDVMCLTSFGYSAISLCSEAVKLDLNDFYKLNSRFKHIISLYDDDTQGNAGSSYLREAYKIPQMKIGYPNIKDISEMCEKLGSSKTEDYLKELMERWQKN